MGRGRWEVEQQEGGDGELAMGRGDVEVGKEEGGEEGARGGRISQIDMMKCLGGPGYRIELQADKIHRTTEAMVFADSHKHMEWLGGMSFVILFPHATPGIPASR